MLLEYDGLTDLKWENIDPDDDIIDDDEEDFDQDLNHMLHTSMILFEKLSRITSIFCT